MALARASASRALSINDACYTRSTRKPSPFPERPRRNLKPSAISFASGSAILIRRDVHQRALAWKAKSGSIRCEQSTQEGRNLDTWVGRVAMVSFTLAITVEITTGKGLLQNLGLPTPLPIVALAVTALVGVLIAVFITQSASKN